jgi:hypothetical protein
MTKEEFFKLCHQAGFSPDEGTGLSGESDDDMEAYVGEYPCGEELLALAKALGVEIKD